MSTTTEPETYSQLKARQHDELNSFEGIFFAFTNADFNKGLLEVGASNENQIAKLGMGGFILKNRIPAFEELLARQKTELAERRKDEKFLLDALVYELCNHEYCITYNPQDALDALGWVATELPDGMLVQACTIAASSDC